MRHTMEIHIARNLEPSNRTTMNGIGTVGYP